ncbi:hypothetical protein VN97_g859 [Penicillium thymicola]|uniref:Secreted protein n=1 Tax=Penicillium thymicola TaxID=293382 RepID=A0AAI9TRZ4_PENTH|nr:hypothetical protein VN97_g859 [Penicillium thymicola]
MEACHSTIILSRSTLMVMAALTALSGSSSQNFMSSWSLVRRSDHATWPTKVGHLCDRPFGISLGRQEISAFFVRDWHGQLSYLVHIASSNLDLLSLYKN